VYLVAKMRYVNTLPFISIPFLSSVQSPYTLHTYTRCHEHGCPTRVSFWTPLFATGPLLIMTSVIRPHGSATYVDAACSYRPSSVVCRSVCLSVTLMSPAKTAAPIELPFGLSTQVGPGNHVLDGGPDPPMGRAILRGKVRPIVK